MSLLDLRHAVGAPGQAAVFERAAERAEPHGAALLADAALFVHQLDHLLRRRRIELARVRLLPPRHVTRELDRGHLHAEAEPEVRNAALAGVARRVDLALDAALAEATGHHDAVHVGQIR